MRYLIVLVFTVENRLTRVILRNEVVNWIPRLSGSKGLGRHKVDPPWLRALHLTPENKFPNWFIFFLQFVGIVVRQKWNGQTTLIRKKKKKKSFPINYCLINRDEGVKRYSHKKEGSPGSFETRRNPLFFLVLCLNWVNLWCYVRLSIRTLPFRLQCLPFVRNEP